MMKHYLSLLLLNLLLVSCCFAATTYIEPGESGISTSPTSKCNFLFNNNKYDLSPLTLKDGSSYKATFNVFKFDFLFNVCGESNYCQKYSLLKNVQSCTTFPFPLEVGNTQTESAVENSNGITLTYTSTHHDLLCRTKTNELVFTCNNSTDFEITDMSISNLCKYTVHINSRFACPQFRPSPNPSACIFGNEENVIDLSPLIIPDNSSYVATFNPVNDASYNVYFSVCGSPVNKCREYKQQKEMGLYQSCQILNQVPPLSVQTGIPSALRTSISYNRAVLNYTSNAYPCASGFYRYNILQLDCDPTTSFQVVSAYESQRCVYNIDIKSKYACSL